MRVWLERLVLPALGYRDSVILYGKSFVKLKNGFYLPLKRLNAISKRFPPDTIISFEGSILKLKGPTFEYTFQAFSDMEINTVQTVMNSANF